MSFEEGLQGNPTMLAWIKTEWAPGDLDGILADRMWYDAFYRYSESEYSSEQLDFLRSVDQFKQNPTDVGLAKQIYDQFVASGAAQQVNLDSSATQPLAELFEDVTDAFNEVTSRLGVQDPSTIFDRAVSGVKTGLSDTLSRFQLIANRIHEEAMPRRQRR